MNCEVADSLWRRKVSGPIKKESYQVYKNRLKSPRPAASPLAKSTRTKVPAVPDKAAKVRACLGIRRPRTRTLFLVLFICESNGISMNWLMVLAEAEMRPTPIVENANNLGSKTSTGARQKPPADVAQTWKICHYNYNGPPRDLIKQKLAVS